MCGIGGIVFKTAKADLEGVRTDLTRMADVLRHRGPDGRGVWTDGLAGLAHTRLSVIDLSTAGSQPMTNDNGTIALTFNGEIYNFKTLRKELEGAGYRFHSHTDTEVILHGYSRWGKGVVDRLHGMFAFAIWDACAGTLFIARDRLGKKPVYYWHGKETFLFASEIKALLTYPDVPRQVNLEAIHHYLTLQYTPSPSTAFLGIHRLPAAHYLSLKPGDEAMIERYWSLPSPKHARPKPIEELKEQLVANLSEAVRMRMVSDVPLGAFLSGGVDSSAVVAFMAQHSSDRVKTFTIGFEEETYDETKFARLVAQRYGTDHHEQIVRPDSMAILPKLVWFYNEPYADPSAIATYYVAEMARQNVTVILNGDGGDEGLLGYGRYEYAATWPKKREDGTFRTACGMAKRAIPYWARARLARVIPRADRFLSNDAEMDVSYSQRYSTSIAYFHDPDKEQAYDEAMMPYLRHSSLDLLEPYFEAAGDAVTGAAWADIHTYLPDDLLVKVDIASMAHSLEARSPLLDQEFFKWTAGIPGHQKMWDGTTKALFKSAMEGYLPHEVLYRPKMGFGVPIDVWLQREMKDFAYELLLSERFVQRGLFRRSYVERLLNEHVAGQVNHQTRLWGLIMLELWFQTWIDEIPHQLTL